MEVVPKHEPEKKGGLPGKTDDLQQRSQSLEKSMAESNESMNEVEIPASLDQKMYVRGFRLIAITAAIMLSVLLVALDVNIIGMYFLHCNSVRSRSIIDDALLTSNYQQPRYLESPARSTACMILAGMALRIYWRQWRYCQRTAQSTLTSV